MTTPQRQMETMLQACNRLDERLKLTETILRLSDPSKVEHRKRQFGTVLQVCDRLDRKLGLSETVRRKTRP